MISINYTKNSWTESHTFAWSEEVVGERERDQAGQGQDEEGEELSLVAHK